MVTTADEIAAIVAADLRPIHDDLALPDICEVQRIQPATNSRGAPSGGYQTHISNVRCALDAANQQGREYIIGSVEDTDTPYTITMPFDTDVTDNDRVVVDGRTFEVISAKQGDGYEIARTLECREV